MESDEGLDFENEIETGIEYVEFIVNGLERKVEKGLLQKFSDSWFGSMLRAYERNKKPIHVKKNASRFSDIVDYMTDYAEYGEIENNSYDSDYVEKLLLKDLLFYGLKEIHDKLAPRLNFRGYEYIGEINNKFNPHGSGKLMTSSEKIVSEGEWNDGVLTGKQYFTGNCKKYEIDYEGDIVEDERHGKGIMKYDGYVYEGDFVEGKKHGNGVMKFKDGSVYEGEFKYNSQNGYGVMKFKNGDIYEGEFKNGYMHGKGVYTDIDGNIMNGDWKHDKFEGYGSKKYGKGLYIGDFVEGERCGQGKLFNEQTGTCLEGKWDSECFTGYGTYRFPNCGIYEGNFVKGVPCGEGKMMYDDGTVLQGNFKKEFTFTNRI